MISILLPSYNDDCVKLVNTLHTQAEAIDGLQFEILVADDGSTDINVVKSNREIDLLSHCRFIERKINVGRAAIRNFLAREAKGEWLLFIDSDMRIDISDYLLRYIKEIENNGSEYMVVYGGYNIDSASPNNLRYRYELRNCQNRKSNERQRHPYQNFHTSNFLISKELMTVCPLNEEMRQYGYEDILFGKQLEQKSIPIHHIDAPVTFYKFESQEIFIVKTEESLTTLYKYRKQLRGYSHLLTTAEKMRHLKLDGIINWMFQRHGKTWRRKLIEEEAPLRMFQLYKLGYYIHLCRQ
ncbi:MAG: glycosyltransferase family 2 protein [Prevotella sp.]|jgi:glycosyltransferase involved in cell wall biosynthesis